MMDGLEKIFPAIDKIVPLEDEHIGADGLPYCNKCNTPRASLYDGKYVFRHICKCREEELEAEKKRQEDEKVRQKILSLKRQSLLGERYTNVCFETSNLNDSNRKAYDLCSQYANAPTEMLKNGYGIYVFGTAGVGKTHLLACMANALMEKLQYTYFSSFLVMSNELRSSFRDSAAQKKILDTFRNIPFLFLDDLGTEPIKEDTNSWLQTIIYDVINRRFNDRLPTICSSNYSLSQLVKVVGYQERTAQRLLEMCPLRFELKGTNYRIENSEERLKAMMSILTAPTGG